MASTVSGTTPAAAEWLCGLASRGAGGGFVVHATESGALLGVGEVVVKVHRAGTDPAALAARLALAGDPRLSGVLASPLDPQPLQPPAETGLKGRLATLWPRLTVLSPDVLSSDVKCAAGPAPPWADAAALLARLHRAPLPAAAGSIGAGGPARLRRALAQLSYGHGPARGAAAEAVLAAGRRAEAELDAAPPAAWACLAHGDWHLGQVGRARHGAWLLVDIDDLGLGDPAWDLARPAGFWAAGLLADEAWAGFLAAYRAAGGPAVPPEGDPWPRLDLPARAEVVVAAARALRRAPSAGGEGGAEGVRESGWDDGSEALVRACARMGAGG